MFVIYSSPWIANSSVDLKTFALQTLISAAIPALASLFIWMIYTILVYFIYYRPICSKSRIFANATFEAKDINLVNKEY